MQGIRYDAPFVPVNCGAIPAEDLGLPEVNSVSSSLTAEQSSEAPSTTAQPAEQNSIAVTNGDNDLEAQLQAQQREIITLALEETRWNRTAAAKKLGITLLERKRGTTGQAGSGSYFWTTT